MCRSPARSECDSAARWGAEARGLDLLAGRQRLLWGDTDGDSSCADLEGGEAATCSTTATPTRAAATSTDAARSPARTAVLRPLERSLHPDRSEPAGWQPPTVANDVPSYTDCDPRQRRRATAPSVQFDPVRARYWDYLLNGETGTTSIAPGLGVT